jgi:hypothetical protein
VAGWAVEGAVTGSGLVRLVLLAGRRPHATEAAQRAPGRSPRTLTLLTWPDAYVHIAEPGPISFIQVGSDAKIQRRCHLIVTLLLEQAHQKSGDVFTFGADLGKRSLAGRPPTG